MTERYSVASVSERERQVVVTGHDGGWSGPVSNPVVDGLLVVLATVGGTVGAWLLLSGLEAVLK